MKELTTHMRIRHMFSVVSSPWTNGSAENINRHLLTSLRALVSKYGLPDHNWHLSLPMIQPQINHKICPRVKLSPNYIFFGRQGNAALIPELVEEPDTFPLTYLGDILQPSDVELLHLELNNFQNELDYIRSRVFTIRDTIQ